MLKKDIERVFWLLRARQGKAMACIGCLRSPSVQAMTTYRFGRWLLQQRLLFRLLLTPLYLWMAHRIAAVWGIDLPRTATIGEGFYIGHFGGVVVAPNAIIGKGCSISQGVTIGVAGRGEKRGCPVIGDFVYVGAGAKIIGKVRVGNYARIGANAVIYKDIPAHATVVLDPGFKILRKDNEEQMPSGDPGHDKMHHQHGGSSPVSDSQRAHKAA